jgi:hypothetical protein
VWTAYCCFCNELAKENGAAATIEIFIIFSSA